MQLSLKQIGKTFQLGESQIEVLRDVSFSIDSGQSLAITGPSGSGKSTLLHLIGTLDCPTTGQIHIANQNPFSLSEPDLARFRNRTIGFVFQEHHLLPQYSVIENVLIPTLAFGKPTSQQIHRGEELLEKVWGYDPQTETRTVDNFISRLRKYFEKKPQKPIHIVTVREKGYQFKSDLGS